MIFIRDNHGCMINYPGYELLWRMFYTNKSVDRWVFIIHVNKENKGKETKASNIIISKHFEILGVLWPTNGNPRHWSLYNCPFHIFSSQTWKPQPPSYYSISCVLFGFGSSSQPHISYKILHGQIKSEEFTEGVGKAVKKSSDTNLLLSQKWEEKYKQIKFKIVN